MAKMQKAMKAMVMKNRWMVMMAAVAALWAADAIRPDVQTASAQEVQISGPLAGAPAVHDMRIYREGRFQIVPFLGFTLSDEYSRNLFVGATVAYHFTDWIGVRASGAYAVAQFGTNLTDEVRIKGQDWVNTRNSNQYLNLYDRDEFENQIGRWDWTVSAEAVFVPLRGKLSFFQKLFVDTDAYVFAGVAFNGLNERASTQSSVCDAAGTQPDLESCYSSSQLARSSRVAPSATFGAGINMYFNDFIGLSFEWRGMPFKWNTSGTDEAGNGSGTFPDGNIDADDRISHFNQMFTIGLVVYLPTEAGSSE